MPSNRFIYPLAAAAAPHWLARVLDAAARREQHPGDRRGAVPQAQDLRCRWRVRRPVAERY